MTEATLPFLSLLAVAVSASITIAGYYQTPPALVQVYICKPLTTVLVMVYALSASGLPPLGYGLLVTIGLVFSLFGDVFLMLPRDRFVAGLLSFLVAHIFFLAAFAKGTGVFCPFFPYPPLFVLAAGVFFWLSPGIPRKLRLPVVTFVFLLSAMTAQAIGRAVTVPSTRSAAAALGAVLFLFSDTTIAINKFRHRFKLAQAVILATYFLAIWLMAFSIEPR